MGRGLSYIPYAPVKFYTGVQNLEKVQLFVFLQNVELCVLLLYLLNPVWCY